MREGQGDRIFAGRAVSLPPVDEGRDSDCAESIKLIFKGCV
jgi:hypothetical protein